MFLNPPEHRNRIASLLDAFVFYGVIALIFLTAIPYGTVDPWSEAMFECAVFLFGLLWVLQGFLQGSWQIGSLRLFLPLVALVLLAIVQTFSWGQVNQAGVNVTSSFSADPFETRLFALRTAALIVAGLLLIRFTSSKKRLAVLAHAIIIVAVASALFGIARQALQHGEGFLLPRLKPSIGYAQFINKNHFAYLMEMAFGLIVAAAFFDRSRRDRMLIYVSALIAVLAAVILSLSRGGLLAISVEAILTALILLKTRSTDANTRIGKWARSAVASGIVIVVLVLAIGAAVVWLGVDQLTTGVETASTEMSGVDRSELNEAARRRDIWQLSWRMFQQHPIIGAGLGAYWAEVPLYHRGSGVLTPQQAHNDYLELLASAGLIGAGIFAWFAIALSRQIRRGVRETDGRQRAIILGVIVSVIGVAVHSVVDFGLHITSNALVFVALLAILSLPALKKTRRSEDMN